MSWPPRRCVLVPIDFSEPSLHALRAAADLAESPTALNLVHVLALPAPAHPGLLWERCDLGARREAAERLLRELAVAEGIGEAHVHALVGDPGRSIGELAEALEADLIVIPTHGRTGLSRWVIGSVTERVVRLAPCAVLVLRA